MDPNLLQALLKQVGGLATGQYAGASASGLGGVGSPPYRTQSIFPSIPTGGFPTKQPQLKLPSLPRYAPQPVPRLGYLPPNVGVTKQPTPRTMPTPPQYTSPGFRSPTPGTTTNQPIGQKPTKLSTLPRLARGTRNFRGGRAIVGEKGPEVVTLPKGSKVVKSLLPKLIRAFTNKPGMQANVEAPSAQSLSRNAIIARALDMMQRGQALNTLRQF